MLLKLLGWYPAIMGIGITAAAAKIYEALRWKKYDHIWRCVHPIKVNKLLVRYQARINSRWKTTVIMAVGWVYEFMFLIEIVISPLYRVGKIGHASMDLSEVNLTGSLTEDRIKLASYYLNTYRVACGR